MKMTTRPNLMGAAAIAAAALFTAHATRAAEAEWLTNFEDAKKVAALEKKDLLIDFTGSDWCGWCKRLDAEVFSKDAFVEGAPKDFVLVELDFPQQKEQTPAIKAQNAELQAKYGIRGFPTIVLTDAEGRPYAQTGYQQGGEEKYLEHLAELKKNRETRDEKLAAAEKAEGAEKAKLLAEAVGPLDPPMILAFYGDVVDQIIASDAEEGEYKKQFVELRDAAAKEEKFEKMMEAVGPKLDAFMQEGKTVEAANVIDETIAAEKPEGEMLQRLLVIKFQIQARDENFAKMLETLDAAEKAAPDTQLGQQIPNVRKQIEAKMAEGKDGGDAGEKEGGDAAEEKEEK